jgi:hypothetical protein
MRRCKNYLDWGAAKKRKVVSNDIFSVVEWRGMNEYLPPPFLLGNDYDYNFSSGSGIRSSIWTILE